jgi:hypothetical protein
VPSTIAREYVRKGLADLLEYLKKKQSEWLSHWRKRPLVPSTIAREYVGNDLTNLLEYLSFLKKSQ